MRTFPGYAATLSSKSWGKVRSAMADLRAGWDSHILRPGGT
jgi:hypothetical protein